MRRKQPTKDAEGGNKVSTISKEPEPGLPWVILETFALIVIHVILILVVPANGGRELRQISMHVIWKGKPQPELWNSPRKVTWTSRYLIGLVRLPFNCALCPSQPVSSERHISTLVAESLRLDFDYDEDDLPLHIEFSASQDRERPSLLTSSFAALASYSTSRPSTPSPQRNTSRDYNPGDHRSYSPDSDLLDEEDSFIDSLDPLFEPYAESSVAIVQSPSAQMPSSPHRRLYPDQSGGSPPSSPLAQRSITRPSPMRRDASTSVPDGTINPFMGGWEVTNSPAASSRSSQRGGHIEYYAGAPLRPGPVTASAPESDDVKENDDVDAPDLKSSEEVKSPSTKILIFHMSLTMTWDFLETLIDKKTRSFIPEMFVNISATFVDEQMLCGKSLGVLDQCCRLFEIVGLPPPTAGVELNEYLYKAFFRAAVVILRDFRSKLPQNNSSNNFAQIVYDNLVYEADAEGLVVAMWCQALEVEVDKAEDEDRNDDMEWRELSRKRKRRFVSNGKLLT
ncbi:hypothetical protein I311_00151 [Cryptococcus gattii NT-10]|nr:hypothetical protein I311_00151 [Cryptococcus gattii NT-10]